MNKHKLDIKGLFKKILMFIVNPKLLLCLGMGWMITNGWSYVMLALGTLWGVPWMIAVSGAYLTFLWFPFTPEKLVTISIAIFLLRMIFPKDKYTLGVLRDMYSKAKNAVKSRRKKHKEKMAENENEAIDAKADASHNSEE